MKQGLLTAIAQLQRTLKSQFAQVHKMIEPILHNRLVQTVLAGIKLLAHTHFAYETLRFLHHVLTVLLHFAK